MTRLVLVGTSHHHAPIALREQVALGREDAEELAARLAQGGREAVCLSTCNRTELYIAAADAEQAEQDAVAALATLGPEVEPALYRLQDRAAAHHLFRVAAGLDSLVPGEGEILGQVRLAHELGTTGPLLDRVFRQALHAGRKVRAQTAIGESPSSVSAAAAALAEQVFGSLESRSILLLGAGKVSEQAARNLRRREADRAEGIVAAEAEKFHEWHASLDVLPAITSLRARAEEIREAELQKAESLLGRLDDSQRTAVEAVTAQIVNKLLHLPTVRMKQAAVAADGVLYAETVRYLFGLGEEER